MYIEPTAPQELLTMNMLTPQVMILVRFQFDFIILVLLPCWIAEKASKHAFFGQDGVDGFKILRD